MCGDLVNFMQYIRKNPKFKNIGQHTFGTPVTGYIIVKIIYCFLKHITQAAIYSFFELL